MNNVVLKEDDEESSDYEYSDIGINSSVHSYEFSLMSSNKISLSVIGL